MVHLKCYSRTYNFLIDCPLPRRKCLALPKMKYTGLVIQSAYLPNKKISGLGPVIQFKFPAQHNRCFSLFPVRTGEFFLHLQASNLVSNSSASSKIFVLTRMCHPPVLDIVGADPRTVLILAIPPSQILAPSLFLLSLLT